MADRGAQAAFVVAGIGSLRPARLRLAGAATELAVDGDSEILRVDADKFTKIYSCTVLETCQPARFDKQNKLVYFITNQGDARDLTELALMDPATGKTTLVGRR